jgi:hypothetical protein
MLFNVIGNRNQQARPGLLNRAFTHLDVRALYAFAEHSAPQNGGYFRNQVWSTLHGGSVTLGAEPDRFGVMRAVRNGSGGYCIGADGTAAFGRVPANSPAWFATVYRHGPYFNNGNSLNCIGGYVTGATTAHALWVGCNSANALMFAAQDLAAAASSVTLEDGATYHLLVGRTASGAVLGFCNGREVFSSSGSTTITSSTASLMCLSDRQTQRHSQGAVGMLAFGMADATAHAARLTENLWGLFAPLSSWRPVSAAVGFRPAWVPRASQVIGAR